MIARVRFTTRADGDLAEGPGMAARRAAIHPGRWSTPHQVHGARVLTVLEAGQHDGAEADALVTAVPGAVLAVKVADCAPVALVGDGAVAVVHAGWRGTEADVLGAAVEAMRILGVAPVRALVGPCIEAGCYEFGDAALDALAGSLGDEVRATTAAGSPAFDLRAGVRRRLLDAGITDVEVDGRCTACDHDLWSFRGAGDAQRQAVVAWLEP